MKPSPKVEEENKYVHQSGGKVSTVTLCSSLEPNKMGKGYSFESHVKGGAVPKEYIKPIEAGITGAMETGVWQKLLWWI
ncbi:MAG: hypothetical protein R2877_08575 [Bdellovibrionota bacterium]